jgi:hypothetical protein
MSGEVPDKHFFFPECELPVLLSCEDDSLSVGGSPPSVKTDDKSKKQPETQEENVETELSFYKTKLALTETKLQNLKDFVSNCFLLFPV